jgi:hypothetical protein
MQDRSELGAGSGLLRFKGTGSRDGIQIFFKKWLLSGLNRNLYWNLNIKMSKLDSFKA